MKKVFLLLVVAVVMCGCGRDSKSARDAGSLVENFDVASDGGIVVLSDIEGNLDDELGSARAESTWSEVVSVEAIRFSIPSSYNIRSSILLEDDNIILEGRSGTEWATEIVVHPEEIWVQRCNIDQFVYFRYCLDNTGDTITCSGGAYNWLQIPATAVLNGDSNCPSRLVQWCEEHPDKSIYVVADGVSWTPEVAEIK